MSDFFDQNGRLTKKAIYLRWFITERCNYKCPYCDQDHTGNRKVFAARDVRNISNLKEYLRVRDRNSRDMFKNFSPDTWLKALEVFGDTPLSLTLTGGEPFLDFKNFGPFLAGLSNMPNVKCIRIDTNGTWNPKNYPGINWDIIYLNFSYHPSMISFEGFLKLLQLKTDNSINIGMVNYVMEPGQILGFEKAYEELRGRGVFVNANVYFGPREQSDEGWKLYRKYIPQFDIDIKTGRRQVKGSPCYYPAIAYEINTAGFINTGCMLSKNADFIKGKLPVQPDKAIPCPCTSCGCLDKYAFLEGSGRAKRFNLLEEFVDECKKVCNYQ